MRSIPAYGGRSLCPRTAAQIVYVGDNADGTRQLWLRSLYSGSSEQALPGTEGATHAVLVARQPVDWFLRR